MSVVVHDWYPVAPPLSLYPHASLARRWYNQHSSRTKHRRTTHVSAPHCAISPSSLQAALARDTARNIDVKSPWQDPYQAPQTSRYLGDCRRGSHRRRWGVGTMGFVSMVNVPTPPSEIGAGLPQEEPGVLTT